MPRCSRHGRRSASFPTEVVAGQLVLGVHPALGRPRHLNRNRGAPLITEQSLIGGGVIGLDEGLMLPAVDEPVASFIVSYRGVSFSSSRVDLLERRKSRTTQCGENYDEPRGPFPKNEEAEVDQPQGHIGWGMDCTRPYRVIEGG